MGKCAGEFQRQKGGINRNVFNYRLFCAGSISSGLVSSHGIVPWCPWYSVASDL